MINNDEAKRNPHPFTDDDLKRLKEGVFDTSSALQMTELDRLIKALLARLEGDESLLDRVIELMKKINGPESNCIYGESCVHQCANHRWIEDAKAWRKVAGK